MTTLTIRIPEDKHERLKALARARNMPGAGFVSKIRHELSMSQGLRDRAALRTRRNNRPVASALDGWSYA